MPAPQVVKIDIEGAEVLAQGARRILEVHRPVVFLATHGYHAHRQCCSLLQATGYTLSPIGSRSLDQTDELVGTAGQGKDGRVG